MPWSGMAWTDGAITQEAAAEIPAGNASMPCLSPQSSIVTPLACQLHLGLDQAVQWGVVKCLSWPALQQGHCTASECHSSSSCHQIPATCTLTPGPCCRAPEPLERITVRCDCGRQVCLTASMLLISGQLECLACPRGCCCPDMSGRRCQKLACQPVIKTRGMSTRAVHGAVVEKARQASRPGKP